MSEKHRLINQYVTRLEVRRQKRNERLIFGLMGLIALLLLMAIVIAVLG